MTTKTHLLLARVGGAGVAALLVNGRQLEPVEGLALAAGAVGASSLPDIDIRLGLPHRGPATHSLLACVTLTLLCLEAVSHLPAQAPPVPYHELVLGVGLGVLLHLIADALTVSGVPLLWPLVRHDVHLTPRGLRVHTAKASESVFVLLFITTLGVLVYELAL